MPTAIHPPGTLHITTVETVVTLPPRFDVHMVAPLLDLLAPFTDIAHHVSLDGSRVEHIDNAGLGLLQELREAFGIVGGEVTLTNMSLALRLGIELSGLPVELCDDLLLDLGTAA
ncbi:lipid asymmetry maintenance protein MlaB [uncultured Ilumatobacter sp.]|jgi:anti-anti-sigma regulatory factor|uniref:STAS domain-containing protein n=1 Tax=uncultured Ilumatobacter sp. TaxID=879968 RepID=UPI00374E72A7|tara:strand:- start:141 stop:485 length:345 start_codon:yes stop_codon:yes gene_type:complete